MLRYTRYSFQHGFALLLSLGIGRALDIESICSPFQTSNQAHFVLYTMCSLNCSSNLISGENCKQILLSTEGRQQNYLQIQSPIFGMPPLILLTLSNRVEFCVLQGNGKTLGTLKTIILSLFKVQGKTGPDTYKLCPAFEWYIEEYLFLWIPTSLYNKKESEVGYSKVYHLRALHNVFIPCSG